MTTPLVTPDEVKAFMSVRTDIDMPEVDARLETLIMLATSQLETALSVEFTYGVRTQLFNSAKAIRRVYDFGGGINEYGTTADPVPQTVLLDSPPIDLSPGALALLTPALDPSLPVPTVPLVVLYDPDAEWGPQTIVDPISYKLDAKRARLTLRIMSIAREQAIQVQYVGGYQVDTETATLTTSAPADLKMACIIQTVHLFTRLQPDNIGHSEDLASGKVGQSPYLTRGGITPEAATLLWSYRRIHMGRY
jgi:hypothetical protein